MPEPTTSLRHFHCTKQLMAGEIVEVCVAGCYVEGGDGTAVLRRFDPEMENPNGTAVGDFWCVDGPRQYVMKRAEFVADWITHSAPAGGRQRLSLASLVAQPTE